MNKNPEQQQNISDTAENNPNSPLIYREEIKNTPFTIINQNEKWFIVMGNYKITENTETYEETLIKLETEKWNIITNVIVIINIKIKEMKQKLKSNSI